MIGENIMTTEQKKLLLEIAQWHNKDFYNRMDDYWTEINYQIEKECDRAIEGLEKEYKTKYGDLPEWNTIDDVWAALKTLKEELGDDVVQ